MEEGGRKSDKGDDNEARSEWCHKGRLHLPLLAVRMVASGPSQGMLVTSERKEIDPSWAYRKNAALEFSSMRPTLDFWPTELLGII